MALSMGNHYFHILLEKRIRTIYCNVGFVNGLLYLQQENNIRSSRQTAYRSYLSGAEKKPPPRGIYVRLNFFNTCAALASLSVNRFRCGFFLWLNFFTEQIIICADIVKAATAEPLLNEKVGK